MEKIKEDSFQTNIKSSHIKSVFVLVLFFAITLLPINSQVAAQNLQKSPILDRELFFGDPEISGAQLSPDGKYIAFIKPFKGTRNIWVKNVNEPFDAAKPITADTARPIRGCFWSQDGKYILYAQDKGGDENFNVYAVNPSETPASGQEIPESRNLTNLKGVRAFIYNVPETDPDAIYIGLNDRDPAWHDLYKIKISTGEKTLIRKNTDQVTAWVFDLKDNLKLATRSASNGDTEILQVTGEGFKKIYSCGVAETCAPVNFHKDGKQVYIMSNKGENVDLIHLSLLDVETGKENLVEEDPLHKVDIAGPIFSGVSKELIGTSYFDEHSRIYWKDKAYEADYKFLKKKFNNKEIGFASLTKDEQLALISVNSDTEPGEVYLFDRKTKALTLQYRAFEKLPREFLSPMQNITYKSSDGLEIPALLTLPKDLPAKNLPLIVMPHGGPWARDFWGYSAYSQFWSNRGYAVLRPNFRASTGYGKKFLNAGNKEWGQKMQDDITWGVKHLIDQGIVDAKRVAIMGGSYGGYATLAGVAFTPDLYAAGVSIVGPSNLISLLETIPPYWESIRKIFYERMGDPSTPEGKAQLERQSPLNSANKIKTPLLVVQGANDPRVKRAESDQIVIALRERNFPVEYIVAPDEGHGFARPVNNMAMLATAEKFLAKHVGGRFQEEATPEVSKRIGEITVDIKTVSLVKKLDPATVGVPKPNADLKAATVSYKANLAIAGQNIAMETQLDIKEEGNTWVATEKAKFAMGELSDTTVIEKGSLVLLKRSISQGPAKIDVDFANNKASGQITFSGQNKPIEAELNGKLFADGAGAYFVIASLPLAEGYSTTFRNFDVQKAKVKLMQLKVTGTENITVPAGTFEAFKVEITSAEGEADKVTIWIAKDSRKPVKILGLLPQANNATITAELVQ